MRRLTILAPALLAGCAAAAPPPEVPVHGASSYICRSEGLGRFVGQPATQALGADMLHESGARTLQWVGHGMMVTMEFSPERLRVFLTADNRVERANCG
jgi:peptidase inhibitor I78 family protein